MLKTKNIKGAYILFIITFFTITSSLHPSLTLAKEKESVALLEFETKGDVSKDKASAITNQFRSQLTNTGLFTVLEKEKVENILKKDGDIINSWKKVAEVAKERSGGDIHLFGAKLMIKSEILKIGEKYFIRAAIIALFDGQVLGSIFERFNALNDIDIKTIAKELIDKLTTIEKNEDSNEKRLSINIWEFKAMGVSNVEASILTDQLRFYLVNSGKFNVLERGEPLKIGLILPADRIIAGSISKLDEKYFISARTIDVKTGIIRVESFEEIKFININETKSTVKKVLEKLMY